MTTTLNNIENNEIKLNSFIDIIQEKAEHTVTKNEEHILKKNKSSSLYGNITPKGMHQIMKAVIQTIHHVGRVVDIGSGLGESTLTLFNDFPMIKEVIGYEIVYSRFHMNMVLLKNYTEYYNKHIDDSLTFYREDKKVIVLDNKRNRRIEIRNYAIPAHEANKQYDLYFFDVDINSLTPNLYELLKNAPRMSMLISYKNLKKMGLNWEEHKIPRIDTSWAPTRGHLFNSYIKKTDMTELFTRATPIETSSSCKINTTINICICVAVVILIILMMILAAYYF